MFRAASIGAVSVFPAIFLFAAIYGAVFGITEMFATQPDFGLKGAWNSVSFLILFGQVFPVLFPVVALAGAAMGILLRGLIRSAAQNGGRE
jgi:hypothetical protein